MLAIGVFQALLNGVGSVIAKLFDIIPNYGVDIVVLTVIIRVLLLPLGYKQIRSMQAMQAIQPKVKEVQKKYKGNKQKQQEETMKLYQQAGVNPLGGCLPTLLQFPFLIAVYGVIRAPTFVPATIDNQQVYELHNNHLPVTSKLFRDVITHQNTDFLVLNLQCSAAQSGTQATIQDAARKVVVAGRPVYTDSGAPVDGVKAVSSIDCGRGALDKVPYYVFMIAMAATTFFQQRQMQKASPASAQNQQTQTMMRIFPALFLVWGYFFPSGLVLYWLTTNLLMIAQQSAMLRLGHIGPDALERRQQEIASRPPKEKGFFARWMEQAQQQGETRRQQRVRGDTTMRKPGGGRKPPPGKGSGPKPGPRKNPGSGGSGGKGNGKKRPKR